MSLFFCILNIALSAIQCQLPYKEEDKIEPFTTAIIKYAADVWKLDKDYSCMVLRAESDSSHFYLYVSVAEKIQRQAPYTYKGLDVFLYGEETNPYFNYKQLDVPHQKKGSLAYTEYPEWRICRHKDGSFCKMLTQLSSPYDDIEFIEKIAEKYMVVGHEPSEDMNRIYAGYEVEKQASFVFGKDSLLNFMHKFPLILSNREYTSINSRYILLRTIVHKNGYAEFAQIDISSGNAKVDSIAVEYLSGIMKKNFTPAILRGEMVNSYNAIVFPIKLVRKGDENADTYIENRSRLMSRRLGYDN